MTYCIPTPIPDNIPSRLYIHSARGIGSDAILTEGAAYFGVSVDDLRSTSRRREFCEPRQIIMNVMHIRGRASLAAVGAEFHRDHTTVIHTNKVVANLCQTNTHYLAVYNNFIKHLEDRGVIR